MLKKKNHFIEKNFEIYKPLYMIEFEKTGNPISFFCA